MLLCPIYDAVAAIKAVLAECAADRSTDVAMSAADTLIEASPSCAAGFRTLRDPQRILMQSMLCSNDAAGFNRARAIVYRDHREVVRPGN
jgi:hypothetical protein